MSCDKKNPKMSTLKRRVKRSGRSVTPLEYAGCSWFTRKDFEKFDVYKRSFKPVAIGTAYASPTKDIGIPDKYAKLVYFLLWRLQDVLDYHNSEWWARSFTITSIKEDGAYNSETGKYDTYLVIEHSKCDHPAIKNIVERYERKSTNLSASCSYVSFEREPLW